MESDFTKKLMLEISGFIFYLYELYVFFYQPHIISSLDGSAEVFFIRMIILIFVLPVLYLFQVAYFFDWGDTLTYFLAGLFKFEPTHSLLQVKLFYHTINTLLIILLILKFIGYSFGF